MFVILGIDRKWDERGPSDAYGGQRHFVKGIQVLEERQQTKYCSVILKKMYILQQKQENVLQDPRPASVFAPVGLK